MCVPNTYEKASVPHYQPKSSEPLSMMKRVLMILIFLSHFSFGQQQDRESVLHSKLTKYLEQQADSGFAFSVLISLNGKVILQDGYGWTDSSHTTRATARTLYNLASITKSFTSIAIYALAAQGKLHLEDTITKYFRNVPADKKSITLNELLVHTTGLQQHYIADDISDRDSAVQRILSDTLLYFPGSHFSYSDENYELLGAIVEIVTHESYESSIRSLVINQADMEDTRFWAEVPGPHSPSTASMNRVLDPQTLARNWGYIGSGGIYSNVLDLYSWFTALRQGMILDSASREDMWKIRHQSSVSDVGIASGWFRSAYSGHNEIWTRGNEDWGHNGVLRWFPDSGLLIIVQSNSGERKDKSATPNRFISDGIADILLH